MAKPYEQLREEYESLLLRKAEAEQILLPIPGVICVSIGVKVTNDLPTDEIGFRVYVEKKIAQDEIPPSERIPTEINQIKTDVEEIDNNITASGGYDKGKYRPLCGGIAIHSAGSPLTVGTLGCLVSFEKEVEDDEIEELVCLLTNYHVLRSDGEEGDHQIAQPDFCCEDCCCRCGEIARLEDWGDIETDNVDCAIARLTKGNEQNWLNEVFELGPIYGALGENDKVVAGETVFKRGISSGLTEGLVIDPTAPTGPVGFRLKGGPDSVSFTNQIFIKPKSPDKPFTSKGDSGAVVLNHLNQVVGLYFADNEVRDEQNVIVSNATKSYANPIQDVVKILGIKILESGTFHSMPLRSTEDSIQIRRGDILDEVTQNWKNTPMARLFSTYFTNTGRKCCNSSTTIGK